MRANFLPLKEILFNYLAPAFLRPFTAGPGTSHSLGENAGADAGVAGYGVAGPALLHQQMGESWEKLKVATGRQA